jgi:ribosome-associated toxin RatA of RatAB toxin-antitoxin module
VRSSLWFVCLFVASAVSAANLAQESSRHDDIDLTVSLDAAEQSGTAAGAVRIHARRETVWALITNCAESLRLVPGLEVCDVLETAPDQSWARIRQVMNYSWYVPKLSYVIQVTYDPPSQLSVERISGDVRTLKGTWVLKSEGDYTVVHYKVSLTPGFWVPHWLVRSALRRDLPRMLRALRARAEAIESQKP